MKFNELKIGATFRLTSRGRLLTKVSESEYRTPWGAIVKCRTPCVPVATI